jgi:hypothetical protein
MDGGRIGGKDDKTIVMGMNERGGRIETKIIPNVPTATPRPIVLDSVGEGFDRLDGRTGGLQVTKGRGVRARCG